MRTHKGKGKRITLLATLSHEMNVINLYEKVRYGDYPVVDEILDTPNLKAVLFSLDEGQEIPPHVSSSEVIMLVLKGEGRFTSENGELDVKQGILGHYTPEELHGFKASKKMVVLAFIVPNPSE